MTWRPNGSSRSNATRTLFLVVPPQRGLLEGFSTGLVAIGNYVRARDPSLKINFLDLGLEPEANLETRVSNALLNAAGRIFVGITGTTASYQSMLRTAQVFKRVSPGCIVVLGGHHVTSQDDIVLTNHSTFVDFIIRGEGEVALSRLLKDYPDITAVPNLSYVAGGAIRRNVEGPLLQEADLDALSPYFEHSGLQSAAGKFGHVTYVSARGCPLSCAFCAVRATAIRAKSIEQIVKDIRYLVADLGYTELAIEDNFFAHSPRRTLALCVALEELQKEIQFSWDCQTRVESMRRADVVGAMTRAGCTAAYLGVESLIPAHLQYLGKALKPSAYLESLEQRALPTMLKAGMTPYLNLQLGLPDETESDHEQTIATLQRFGLMATRYEREITIFPQLNVIYPGTPHFDLAVARGDFGPLGDEVFEFFTRWENTHQPILNYLGEHFAHGVGGIPLGILDRDSLKKGEFAVSPDALASVTTHLRRMAVRGVSIFKYGEYLARDYLPLQGGITLREAHG